MTVPSGPALRVVIVTYSPGAALDTLLGSLVHATDSPYEVVLADNGSTDGMPERAARQPAVTLRPTGANLGYGGAANVGARGATAPWLLVANPDVEFEPKAIDVLLDATARWPRGAAFGPAICTEGDELYPSARTIPTIGRGIGHALLGWWWPSNPWTASYRKERGAPEEGAVGWLSGSCLLLRREAFEAVGGFDPGYFMYFEDLDLCERLGRAGWQSVYVPAAVILHLGGHASKREPMRMVRSHHRSAYRYVAGRYRGLRWAPLRAAVAAGLAARYVLAMLVRRLREGAPPTRSADVLPR